MGTGVGYGVLQIEGAFEKTSGKKIPNQIVDRRPGNVAIWYADPEKAKIKLGWTAEKGIDEMCRDSWRWQSQNPAGYTQ